MKRFFLLGICGASMSSLAIFLKHEGHLVRGYDLKSSPELEKFGITVFHEERPEEVKWADEVVFSSAFKLDFPLIVEAKKLGKKVYPRGKLLGNISSQYSNVIAVAGSHGKSTVTAMIFSILKAAGLKPTLHDGALLKESGRSYEIGEKDYFVTEACEYCDNFLFLHPSISVITNVEREHLDYFGSFSREKASFDQFARQSAVCIRTPSFSSKNVRVDKSGRLSMDVFQSSKKFLHLSLAIGGRYNEQNALYAIEAAVKANVSKCYIKIGLESFRGLQKRFEKMHSILSANVILDYAHHPHEIEKLFLSLPQSKRRVALFQPHTFSRTRTFMEDFVKALSKFDEVILFKTYPAREKLQPEVEIELLKKLSKRVKATLFYDVDGLIQKLKGLEGATLAIVGAGDLPELLQQRGVIWRDNG